jgi:hypothetical protein
LCSSTYLYIREKLSSQGFEVVLPELDSYLDQLDPQEFYNQISKRLDKSDFVITVFPEMSKSAPVEATLASFKDKAQYIITGNMNQLSRLLRGLPNVKKVVQLDDVEELLSSLKDQEGHDPPYLRYS